MKHLYRTKLKEVKNLHFCDLLTFMDPLRILKEETRCQKSDLQGFHKDLTAAG